jgi:hypothetical protein
MKEFLGMNFLTWYVGLCFDFSVKYETVIGCIVFSEKCRPSSAGR